MNRNELVIATISLVRNEEEEKALRTSLKALAALGVPVVVTDGGSPETFVSYLKSFPHFKVLRANGLWRQAKESITEAGKTTAKAILYTEPDKLSFFAEHLSTMIEACSVTEHTGVILASRSAAGFSTFPQFQQTTETTINQCCKEIIGKEVDYCYGPFLFNSRLLPFLEPLQEDCGWGWRPFLFTVAHRVGLSVDAFVGEFECPPDQRADDATEKIYRMKQLTQNINGLVQAATINLQKEVSEG